MIFYRDRGSLSGKCGKICFFFVVRTNDYVNFDFCWNNGFSRLHEYSLNKKEKILQFSNFK